MQKTQPIAGQAAPAGAAPPLNLAGTILLAALTTALVALASGVVVRLLPWWRPAYLVAACFLVAVEAALVRYRMREGRHLSVGAVPYLAAELFALVALTRAVASLSVGPAAAPDLELWLRSPLAAIDIPFVSCLLAGLACAVVVRLGLGELANIEPPMGPIRTEHALDAEIFRARAESDERDAVARLASGLGWGGALALVAIVIQLADLRPWGGSAGSLPPAMALAGMVYLGAGVLLYSRARLSQLQARWRRDDAPTEPGVARRWRRQSLLLVLAAVAIGLALPRSYGAGAFEAARTGALAAVNLLGLAALALGLLAMGALGIALTIPALLLALLGGAERTSGPIAPVEPPPPPPPPAPVEPPLAPGVVFWACMALLAGYALWTVLRRQAWAVAAYARLRAGVLAPLAAWLRGLWGGAAGYARKVGGAVAERLRRHEPPPPAARPRLSLRRLAPGERVRYFYASTVRRAERGGLGRRPADTPYEYGARLREGLPDAAEDVDQLTEAYLAAAYAPRPTTPAEAQRARGPWERLKRRLRGAPREKGL